MAKERFRGIVLRVTGHEVWVETGGRTAACLLRGRFRKKEPGFQVVAGDGVEVTFPGGPSAHGAIEAVDERRSWLSRYVGGRVSAERVIVANIDRLFVVVSMREPRLNLRFVDRVLVSAERGHVDACLCLNKIDQFRSADEGATLDAVYAPLGYEILRTSAATGEGIDRISAQVRDGVYAFVGQSGVGKSSLLNRIDPALDLKVDRVAHKTGRGRHTTTYSQLFPINRGHLADTPGMQTFGFPGQQIDELASCFREFVPYQEGCRFHPCTHTHEPDCAVKGALEARDIAESRYESYVDMLAEVKERESSRY